MGLRYFVELETPTGRLARLTMVPTRIRKFRVQLATAAETGWLWETLNRESRRLGSSVRLTKDGALALEQVG